MDITARIRKEHQDVDGMLQELSREYDKQLFKKLKLTLTAHMSAEEGTLYLAMAGREQDLVKRAEGEHQEIRKVLGRFLKGEASELSLLVSTLAEAVREHIKHEEQDVLPRAQEALEQEKVDELSYQFEQIEKRIIERSL